MIERNKVIDYNYYCSQNHETLEELGEIVCKECGLEIQPRFENPFLLTSSNTEMRRNAHYGGEARRIPLSRGAYMGYNSPLLKDVNGKVLESTKFKRLMREDRIMTKKNEKRTRIGLVLDKIVKDLNLKCYHFEDALYRYEKIKRQEKIINNISCIAYCLWETLKLEKSPISLNELMNCFRENGHRLNNKLLIRDSFRYNKYLKENNIKTRIAKSGEDYLSKFIYNEKLKVIENKAMIHYKSLNNYQAQLYNTASSVLAIKGLELDGLKPPTLAVAVIYFADIVLSAKNKHKRILTQKILEEITNIIDASFRIIYLSKLKPLLKNNIKNLDLFTKLKMISMNEILQIMRENDIEEEKNNSELPIQTFHFTNKIFNIYLLKENYEYKIYKKNILVKKDKGLMNLYRDLKINKVIA